MTNQHDSAIGVQPTTLGSPGATLVEPASGVAEEQDAEAEDMTTATAQALKTMSRLRSVKTGRGLAAGSSPVVMFKDKHVFVELHEFLQDHWQESRRWNHGLEQELPQPNSPKSKEGRSASKDTVHKWTNPHLPTISLLGMAALREALKPQLIFLDVDSVEQPLAAVAERMLESLHGLGRIPESERARAREALLTKINTITESAVVAHASVANVCDSPKKSKAELGSLLPKPRNGSTELSELDPLKPEAEEETVHILTDMVSWLDKDAVCVARFSEETVTGLEEQQGASLRIKARFLIICLGVSKSKKSRRHVEIGEAAAAMFQDDRVVRAAYGAQDPKEVLAAFEVCFKRMKVVPDSKVPQENAILKRAKLMLSQMMDLKADLTQDQRWLLRQKDPFSQGLSIGAVFTAMQKFAVPLLSGIALALALANLAPAEYDRWFGHGPRYGGGQDGASAAEDGHRGLGGGGAKDDRPNAYGLEVHGHPFTIHFVVNDILMCLFFGLAGKEITEALQPGGSLYPPTRTTVNVLAATLGGVLGPIAVYFMLVTAAYSAGLLDESYSLAEYTIGWGVPTATDISLAWVTAICVFGVGHPAINYLLLLAIIDDGIGLMIIAFAYPDPHNPLKPKYMALVIAAMVVALVLRKLRCARWQMYVVLAGPLSWIGLLYTGLHPSLALVFVVPLIPLHVQSRELDFGRHAHDRHAGGSHPLHEFEESVKTFIDFLVLFAFGTCNAGVSVDGAGWLTVIVLLSLVCGKTFGVLGTSMIATCFGCPPPGGMTKATVAQVGFIASAGLTVALFVSGEAFSATPELATQSKMGALLSVVVAFVAIAAGTARDMLSPKKEMLSEDNVHPLDMPRAFSQDVALEDMVVNTTVKNLNLIHSTTLAIESRAAMSRASMIEMLQELETV